jgi:uncharacterized protein (TIGR02147 family)
MSKLLWNTSDYRHVLRAELESRLSRNPVYSLRAFARDLGISCSRLSEVLSGRYGLSREASLGIAARLGLSPTEQQFFGDLVESRHARSRVKRELAKARLKLRKKTTPENRLALDRFQLIADWYHYAILELTYLDGFQSDAVWIARFLEISETTARDAIERLQRLGLLIVRDGRFAAVDDFFDTESDVPSQALRKFHRQILEKAIDAIHLQTVHERELSAMVLAVRREQIPEAKTFIREFQREFVRRFGDGANKDDVYTLSTQFFSLKGKALQ